MRRLLEWDMALLVTFIIFAVLLLPLLLLVKPAVVDLFYESGMGSTSAKVAGWTMIFSIYAVIYGIAYLVWRHLERTIVR